MNRRTLIAAGTAGIIGAGGVGVALGSRLFASDDEPFDYRGGAPIVYERDDLAIEIRNDPVRLGESASFAITNTGNERIIPGFGVAWALQAKRDGRWTHVSWTPERLVDMCATLLEPGQTRSIEVPTSESGHVEKGDGENPALPLESGAFRLVLVRVDPYLATDFQVLPADG